MKQLLLHTINGQAYSEKDVMETEVASRCVSTQKS